MEDGGTNDANKHQVVEISPDTGANINITNSIQNLNTDFPIYKRSNSVSGVGGGVNETAKGTMTVSWLDDHDCIQTYNPEDTYVIPKTRMLLLSNRVRKQGIVFDSANERIILNDRRRFVPVEFNERFLFRLPTVIHSNNATQTEGNTKLARIFNSTSAMDTAPRDDHKLMVADLCGGVGCVTHVFHEAGHTVSAYCDKNETAIMQYLHCNPSVPVYNGLLTSCDNPYFRLDTQSTDIAIIGTPCEDFFTLNVERDCHSHRSMFTTQAIEALCSKLSLKMILLENATNMSNHSHIIDEFERIGAKYGYHYSVSKSNSRAHDSLQSQPRAYHFFTRGDMHRELGEFSIQTDSSQPNTKTIDDILSPRSFG